MKEEWDRTVRRAFWTLVAANAVIAGMQLAAGRKRLALMSLGVAGALACWLVWRRARQ